MKVWIAEQGLYDDRSIVGVYATVEAAIAANPPSKKIPEGQHGNMAAGQVWRGGGWQENGHGGWWNGLDWQDSVHIDEWEVES